MLLPDRNMKTETPANIIDPWRLTLLLGSVSAWSGRNMPRFVTTLLVLVRVSVWARVQANAQTVVLMGARGIDGTGRAPIENAVVLIADGKIQVMGKNGVVAIPKQAREINASGKTLMPVIEPSASIPQRST